MPRPTKEGLFILLPALLALTLLNYLQAGYTGILFDEAYYWYLAQELDWGYFDHPPMVALFIWTGLKVFSGTLGIRLFAPLLHAGSMLLLYLLIPMERTRRNTLLFALICFSTPLWSIYGVFMLPDTPLMFFGLSFLLALKYFFEQQDPLRILWLALSMAAVMYCKYHGVLLIGLSLLPFFRQWHTSGLWYAAGLALLLYLPHFWWLYQHDWISVNYHLINRADSAYEPGFTLNYFLSCLLIPGLLSPYMYKALIGSRPSSSFEKALKITGIGVLLFFLISSFNRKTQAQWVNLSLIPMIYFTMLLAVKQGARITWLPRLALAGAGLMVIARIGILLPDLLPFTPETAGNEQWTQQVSELAGDHPVVFHNSYRDAAMYSFFTGKTAYALSDLKFRQHQYLLNQSEFQVRKQKVLLFSKRRDADSLTGYLRPFRKEVWRGRWEDNFMSYDHLSLRLPEDTFTRLKDTLLIRASHPYAEAIDTRNLNFRLTFFDDIGRILEETAVSPIHHKLLHPGQTESIEFSKPELKIPEKAVTLRLGIACYGFRSGFQSNIAKK